MAEVSLEVGKFRALGTDVKISDVSGVGAIVKDQIIEVEQIGFVTNAAIKYTNDDPDAVLNVRVGKDENGEEEFVACKVGDPIPILTIKQKKGRDLPAGSLFRQSGEDQDDNPDDPRAPRQMHQGSQVSIDGNDPVYFENLGLGVEDLVGKTITVTDVRRRIGLNGRKQSIADYTIS